MPTNVLAFCTRNSARSVLAEGMLNHWAARLGHDVRACSVGSAPSGRIDPHALDGLGAAGVDAVGDRMLQLLAPRWPRSACCTASSRCSGRSAGRTSTPQSRR